MREQLFRVVKLRPSLLSEKASPRVSARATDELGGQECGSRRVLSQFHSRNPACILGRPQFLFAALCLGLHPMSFSNVIRLHDICAIVAGLVKHMSWGGGFIIQIPALTGRSV